MCIGKIFAGGKSWTLSKLRPMQTLKFKAKKYAKKQGRAASVKLKRQKVKSNPRRKREEEATSTLYS